MQRFQLPWSVGLALRLCWCVIRLITGIHQFGAELLRAFESYLISAGLYERYRKPLLHSLRHLAVVVDSGEARNTAKVRKLLRWLSDMGVESVMLYDMEGVLKKSLGDLSSFINGVTSVQHQVKMTIELLSFADNKGGIAKAATFICSKYLKEGMLANSDNKDFTITETEISGALNAMGCGGPEPDLLLVYGPVRCHLGFPAWRISYTEIVHMGPLRSLKYGAILKAFFEFSKKQQNYGT